MSLMFGYVHEQEIRSEACDELFSKLMKLRKALDAADRSAEFADAATNPELLEKLCAEFGIS